MFCTNCGAQSDPGEKFCLKCGSPIDPAAVNIGGVNMTAGADGQKMNAVGYTRQPIPVPKEPKKTKVWPIVVGVVAGTLVLSAAAGFAVHTAVKSVFSRAETVASEQFEEFSDSYADIDEIMEEYGLDDFDPGDYDFSDFENFDIEEFMEEYEDYFGDEDGYTYDSESYDTEQFEFADAYYYDDHVCFEGRGTVNDSTILLRGKTAGEFCDYIDSEVLEKGRKIDRELLYDLIAVHLVDPSKIVDSLSGFETSLIYCLTFANEFGNLDMDVDGRAFNYEDPSTYYYEIEAGDRDDTWVVNYSEKYLYMNEGNTEYTSAGDYSMFSDDTLSLWMVVIEEFFEIG